MFSSWMGGGVFSSLSNLPKPKSHPRRPQIIASVVAGAEPTPPGVGLLGEVNNVDRVYTVGGDPALSLVHFVHCLKD